MHEEVDIEYTANAYQQDSGLAMKGDVIRGLIELITNCDDAYMRAKKTGRIQVIVRRSSKRGYPPEIVVRDAATGLDKSQVIRNFTILGGDMSGFAEGQAVRGLFSRGSKDTAVFGETLFETIKGGVYTALALKCNVMKVTVTSHKAEASQYELLGLSPFEDGLSATMRISKTGIRVPELRQLVDRLSTHIQLRRILCTQDVTIAEYVDGKLSQSLKVVWEAPKASVLLNESIPVPGYDVVAQLEISQLETRSDGPVDSNSLHGIEVRGRHATYMNTMFEQSSSSTAFIRGVLTVPAIDDMIRSFAAGNGDLKNPIQLVSRTRDGLENTHPFMRALTAAVLEKLKPILQTLEPKASESGSPELRKDLTTLAQLLAEEMKFDLDEEEDIGLGGNLPTTLTPIIVIPRILKARLGSRRTLTVLVRENSAAASGLKVAISSVACRLLDAPTKLERHPSFADTLVGQVRLDMTALGSATVVVSAESNPKESGVCEVVVHVDELDEEEPTRLEWKNPSMSVTVGKTRSVCLRAPLASSPTGELAASIAIGGTNVRLTDHTVTMSLTAKGWLEAKVHVVGISHLDGGGGGTITATTGEETADGTIRVTVPTQSSGLHIEIDVVDRFEGASRGSIKTTDIGLQLIIFGRHRALKDRLGSRSEDGSYSRDREIDARVVIAEVMASVAADYALMKKVTSDPGTFDDINRIVFEREKLVDRYLKILLEGLNAS
jgi:hypothetical protein